MTATTASARSGRAAVRPGGGDSAVEADAQELVSGALAAGTPGRRLRRGLRRLPYPKAAEPRGAGRYSYPDGVVSRRGVQQGKGHRREDERGEHADADHGEDADVRHVHAMSPNRTSGVPTTPSRSPTPTAAVTSVAAAVSGDTIWRRSSPARRPDARSRANGRRQFGDAGEHADGEGWHRRHEQDEVPDQALRRCSRGCQRRTCVGVADPVLLGVDDRVRQRGWRPGCEAAGYSAAAGACAVGGDVHRGDR